MNSDEFLRVLRQVALDAAVEGTMEVLRAPPGRRPRPELVRASEWFTNLPDESRKMVREIARMSAHSAVFGFLCVIDGVRQVENFSSDWHFELLFARGDEKHLLNPPDGEFLHDILNGQLDDTKP